MPDCLDAADDVLSPMTSSAAMTIRPTLQTLRRPCRPCTRSPRPGASSSSSWKPGTRAYWITTEGVPQKTTGTPINYVLDYVTVEKLTEDGHWDLKAVYSPEAWKLSQGFDYCQMLSQELIRLHDQLDNQFSWETRKHIECVQRELELTNRAIFELSEKVRQRWG